MTHRLTDTRAEYHAGPASEPEAKPANLLPCPFCGGEPYFEKALRDGYESYQDDQDAWAHWVTCTSCAATGPWVKSQRGAARWWNMRTGK